MPVEFAPASTDRQAQTRDRKTAGPGAASLGQAGHASPPWITEILNADPGVPLIGVSAATAIVGQDRVRSRRSARRLLTLARLEEHLSIFTDHLLVFILELDSRIAPGNRRVAREYSELRSSIRSQTEADDCRQYDRCSNKMLHATLLRSDRPLSLSTGEITKESSRRRRNLAARHGFGHQYESELMTSPWLRVPSAHQVWIADRVFDEFHGPVAEADIDPAGVVARSGGRTDPPSRPSRLK